MVRRRRRRVVKRKRQREGALARRRPRLVDKIAEGASMVLSGPAPTEESEGMAEAPIERLLKDNVKKKEPEVIEIEADKPVVKKKKLKKSQHQKETVFAKTQTETETSGYKTPESQIIPPYLSPGAKKTLKSLVWKEREDSPKGGGKGKKKLKKTDAEKLQEGFWEKWRKKLDYASDEEDD